MPDGGIMEVPMSFSPEQRMFLQEIRNAVIKFQASSLPPRAVTNLKATGKAGGVIVQFTQSDADRYTLYAGNTADFSSANPIDLSNAQTYTDELGAAGVNRYYWVKGFKFNGQGGEISGPVVATTLGLGVAITPPTPPPVSDQPVIDDTSGDISKDSLNRFGY
jgi:hypothetical protein